MKQRYAAELMFFYDKKEDGKRIQKKYICERKIYLLLADQDEEAYKLAMAKGEGEEFSFFDDPYEIDYKFLGVSELISLEDEDEDVVWWGFEERLHPEKRKAELLPAKTDLRVFKIISNKGEMKLLDG